MKPLVAILTVCVLAAIFVAYRAVASRENPKPNPANKSNDIPMTVGEFVVVPASVSKGRVARTGLPENGSEDKKQLLKAPSLKPKAKLGDETDYRPNDSVEWIVDIQFAGDPVLFGSKLSTAFNRDWLRANGSPTVFGWSPEIKHWTYLIAGDAPKTFTKICLGWQLFERPGEESSITADDLKRFFKSTLLAAEQFGQPTAKMNRSAADSIVLAHKINQLVEKCGKDVVVTLVARPDKPFDGQEFWDVMKCLGLEWGDGDYFHWANESGVGDDYFFSVGTKTPPGYFLPEQIAAGNVKLGDLVFAYSLPRCAAPEQVFDSMLRAVQYAQHRLGGTVFGEDGKPLNEAATRVEIKRTVERLRQSGFEPGSDTTLYVF
jgi:cell division protein ZipA